jgi:plastocyanin
MSTTFQLTATAARTTRLRPARLRGGRGRAAGRILALLGVGLAGAASAQPALQPLAVDAHPVTGSISNVNGVLEPGETVEVDTTWTNSSITSQTVTGTASNLTGLAGPTYTLNHDSADYGTVGPGAAADCHGASANCYLVTVSGARPAAHWDAVFTESLSSDSVDRFWTLHVGNSFADVPNTDPFYDSIETIFHNGITAGCNAPGSEPKYCVNDGVTRAQMAVLLLKGKFGSSHVPPHVTGTVFNDVHFNVFAADWIEELAALGITNGCGNGDYCPNDPVTRAQMAVILLRSEHGSAYAPPACAKLFADVPCPSTLDFPYSDWIERLYDEGITGGCAPAPPDGLPSYCPGDPVTRAEMAVFLVKTFGLVLYGPSRTAGTHSVSLVGMSSCSFLNPNWKLSPAALHVRAGDTVNWVWSGGFFGAAPHSTTSVNGLWDSGVHDAPYTFSYTFTQPGSFSYYCSHGHDFHYSPYPRQCIRYFGHEGGVIFVDP